MRIYGKFIYWLGYNMQNRRIRRNLRIIKNWY